MRRRVGKFPSVPISALWVLGIFLIPRPTLAANPSERLSCLREQFSSLAPVVYPKQIKSLEVLRDSKEAKRALTRMGVKFEEVDGVTAAQSAIKHHGAEEIGGESSQMRALRVMETPRKKAARSGFSKALLHPDFDRYKKLAEEWGASIVVDPTLKASKVAGMFFPVQKRIAIRADSPWYVFIHEFEHLRFSRAMSPELLQKIRHGESILKLVPKETLDYFGRDYLLAIQKLYVERGWPLNSINEHLAVQAERGAMRNSPLLHRIVRPVRSLQAEQYALSHLIHDLHQTAKSRPLTVIEIQELDQAIARYRRIELSLREYHSTEGVAIGVGLGVPPLLAISHFRSKDYPQPSQPPRPPESASSKTYLRLKWEGEKLVPLPDSSQRIAPEDLKALQAALDQISNLIQESKKAAQEETAFLKANPGIVEYLELSEVSPKFAELTEQLRRFRRENEEAMNRWTELSYRIIDLQQSQTHAEYRIIDQFGFIPVVPSAGEAPGSGGMKE